MRYWFIALRNLNRRRQRAILTGGAIAVIIIAFFSLAVLYVSVSVAPRAGFQVALGRQIGYPYFADMMVVGTPGFRPHFLEAGSPVLVPPTLADYAALLARLDAEPAVAAAAPRLGSFPIATWEAVRRDGGVVPSPSPGRQPSLYIQGIDPEREHRLRGLGQAVIQGEYLERAQPGQAIVGFDFASLYDVGVGDRLRVAGAGFEGEFLIGGIFLTNSPDDARRIFVTLEAAQALTGQEGLASEVAMVAKPARLQEVAPAVSGLTEHDVLFPSREMVPDLGTVLSVWSARETKVANTELLALLGVLGWIFIFQAMLSNVWDRTREIGILKAIGWAREDVLRSIMAEATILGLLGGSLGYLAGIAAPGLLSALGLGPLVLLEPTLGELAGSVGVAVLICLAGGLIPADMASTIPPLEAMGRL